MMELVNELTAADAAIAAAKFRRRRLRVFWNPGADAGAVRAVSRRGDVGADGRKDAVLRHAWPKFDEALAREDEIEMPVQINGKLRTLIKVPAGRVDEKRSKPRRGRTRRCRPRLPARRS